ncbi:CLUMA_CG017785, isoform A [Clunio marinus]|uniref:Transporter n=1 Tax=Clunio marinus TaxID=568069 RepID=A0A1J1IWZ2_9DIPT|nr:CLUMA_CG017785, isoform A [Clunio marinus]
MDSQTNALYDNENFPKYGVSELTFNALNKTPKPKPKSLRDKKFVIVPAGSMESGKGIETSTTPFLSPSTSFSKSKSHISMRGHRLGEPSVTSSNPNIFMGPKYVHLARSGSYIFNDNGSTRVISDASSVRSLVSIGMGSTDGRRMVIRRVPNSPSELLSYISPPTPPEDLFDNESFDNSDCVDDDKNLKPRRQYWTSKMQFVLACIGYSVGLSNVWRFPYIMYKSGGGVFLLPYFITLLICGVPLLFMELSIGQFTGRGVIGAIGQCCPLFKGVGLASVIVSFLMSSYYSVIIAYSIYFFFTSFRSELPWTGCINPRWTTPDCWTLQRKMMNLSRPDNPQTPTEEFFQNKVLQMSEGIEYPGAIRWDLVACLVCAWFLVYFAIWKSIKSSTKIRYFTASFPFVLIIIFLARSLTLEGAEKGLQFFFRPNWSELTSANVWINAAGQSFNSLGIAFGSMISFASYNKYNNNVLHDVVAVSSVNFLTSMLVGIFSFATIGNIAYEQNLPINKVIEDGPGLIFIVYPQALARMPAPQLWSVLFFFMLLCLGLNSQFAIVEVVVTSIQDGFPNWIRQKLVYHEILVLIICAIAFFFGLPNIIQGGIYFFLLIDHYVASITVLFVAFFQIVAISWFYGITRLMKNIKEMTSKNPSVYFRFCWFIAAPALLLGIMILALINYQPLTYHNGTYEYPFWAHIIGWGVVIATILCIPAFAIFNVYNNEGSSLWERIKNTGKPNIYECKICKEHHCEHDFPEDVSNDEQMFRSPSIVLQPPPSKRSLRSDEKNVNGTVKSDDKPTSSKTLKVPEI